MKQNRKLYKMVMCEKVNIFISTETKLEKKNGEP